MEKSKDLSPKLVFYPRLLRMGAGAHRRGGGCETGAGGFCERLHVTPVWTAAQSGVLRTDDPPGIRAAAMMH